MRPVTPSKNWWRLAKLPIGTPFLRSGASSSSDGSAVRSRRPAPCRWQAMRRRLWRHHYDATHRLPSLVGEHHLAKYLQPCPSAVPAGEFVPCQRVAPEGPRGSWHRAHAASNGALWSPVRGFRRPNGVWLALPLFAALSARPCVHAGAFGQQHRLDGLAYVARYISQVM
jgi:hypothetical protein